MSICVTALQLTAELEQKVIDEVVVEKVDASSNSFARPRFASAEKSFVRPYRMAEDHSRIYLPFAWALTHIPGAVRADRSTFQTLSPGCKFTSQLRAVQAEIKSACVSSLNERGNILISLYPGAGKTCLSIFLASRIGLKTLIVCHRLVLMEQWKQALERFLDEPKLFLLTPATLSRKKGPSLMKEADFVLVNAQNVKKMGAEVFRTVGLVIIDEIHAIMAESLSECLAYLSPRYLIGLSATPHRPDGLDHLLDFYFGDSSRRIVRELYHPHDVYHVPTTLTFEEDSKTQWSALISSQCLNERRNRLIASIVMHFRDRHFLVLCKRVEQAQMIAAMLEEEKEVVSVMTETVNTFDPNARVIVASLQKCGVGFSHDVLDALVMASDVEEYFIQYLARVMRTEQVRPMVFDLVDDHPTLKRHFRTRKNVCEKAGGVVHSFWKEFSQFDAFKKL